MAWSRRPLTLLGGGKNMAPIQSNWRRLAQLARVVTPNSISLKPEQERTLSTARADVAE